MGCGRPASMIGMKPFLFATGVLALGLMGCISVDNSDRHGRPDWSEDKAEARQSRTGAVPGNVAAVVIANRSGRVSVTGTDEDFGWSWELVCWGKDAATVGQRLSGFQLETRQEGDRWFVTLVPEVSPGVQFRFESHLAVRVPRTARVEVQNAFGPVQAASVAGVTIRNHNGEVRVSSVPGPVEVANSFAAVEVDDVGAATLANQNGALRVTRINGPLDARTRFGPLTVLEVTGDAKLHNQNGAIEANAIGGSLIATTAFGPLRVEGVGGTAELRNQNGLIAASAVAGNLDASTSFAPLDLDARSAVINARNQNGRIRIVAQSDDLEWIEATTAFSPIEVILPGTVRPLVRAETSFGKVRSDFPVLMWDSLPEAEFKAEATRPKLSLRTRNADVHLRRSANP